MNRKIDLHKTSLCGPVRESNEDVETYNLNLANYNSVKYDSNLSMIDFCAVCDGHGGKDVAEFVVPRLQKYLMKRNLSYPLQHIQISKIFGHIQKELINNPYGIANACGCTALVLIRYLDKYGKDHLQIINLGDCRAVLSRKGLALPLSKDHKPFWSEEKTRIDSVNRKHNLNQRIHYDAGDWRIGDLSVSRAFGDLDNTPYVTHEPEIFDYSVTSVDEFIILACDGLWDVLQNHEAVNFVRDFLTNNNIEYYNIPQRFNSREVIKSAIDKKSGKFNIARLLAEYAIARGSTDNISIIILIFDR